ncbi:MAG: cytochrome c family protein [Desulfobacterales bacterium]|nr:cytochrome c family protein [Desulfobacterales bacterium]
MKKAAVSLILILAGCALLMAAAAAQEDMVVVDPGPFENPQRPPSTFRHEEHNLAADIWECNVCHHVYDEEGNLLDDESSEDMRCADCHFLEDTGTQPGLMKAFHLNCKGCHIKEAKGPVMCGECHRWRQPAADGPGVG